MDSKAIEELLKDVELFKGLTPSESKELISEFETLTFQKDQVLFEQNTDRSSLYVITAGKVQIYKKSALGDEKSIIIFGKTDFIGEGALMDEYPHSTCARALETTEVIALSRDKFNAIVSKNPQIGQKVLANVAKVLAFRMRQVSAAVIDSAAHFVSGKTRSEHDLLGDREVPEEFYYGVQTLRATENFNISGMLLNRFPEFIKAFAQVKMAAAKANYELGLLTPIQIKAICESCEEVMSGKFDSQFVVDLIQGGAGTSTNMNANEVIANRALELMGHKKGEYQYCHPNNHINMAQSTNDAYPTAMKVAFVYKNQELVKVLKGLVASFRAKAKEFANVIKMGRTQLQDAVPMTLGSEFEMYAVTLEDEIVRLDQNARLFLEVNLGGTAIGTGINSDPRYRERAIYYLWEITGLPVRLASNLIEATQDTGALVMYSAAVKRLAIKLSKICNDLRLLASGPRTGISEIKLPPMQPGSSIMPGKVNPVIPEVVNQVAFKVIGNDLTVTMASEAAQLELNVMEPVIAQSVFESVELLKNGIVTLQHRCIDGIQANEERCRNLVEHSIGLVTALNPVIGYENSTKIAKEALDNNRSVYDLVLEKGLLTKAQLDELLLPENMLQPRAFPKKENA